MERLTAKNKHGKPIIKDWPNYMEFDIINRLAAYEDTGLEPCDYSAIGHALEKADRAQSDLTEMIRLVGGIGLDRLRELAQADREERCVVLPAGIGDTVYHITTCKNFSQVLDGTMYGPNGELGTATGLYCPCELAETCPFPCDDDGSFDCEKHKNTLTIFEDVVAGVFIEDMQDVITFGYSGSANFEDFGKTVFLTRAEAEEALRREQDGN